MNITVAFDVDGTLITQQDKPRYEIIAIFKSLQNLGCDMVIWSGGGQDYAAMWCERLGLEARIKEKASFVADIAFDDMPSDDIWNSKQKLGKVLIKV